MTHAVVLSLVCTALQPSSPAEAGEPQPQINWREAEAPLLSHWSQLTFRRDFVKAGEAYFSPDGRRIIFQAVPVPAEGQQPEQHYSMYVAGLTRDAEGGPVGLTNTRRISPRGSANTCGWFHPTHQHLVLFGSTIEPPMAPNKPGFQVGTNRYVWSFPENMKIVTLDLSTLKDDEEPAPTPLFKRPGYCAEASWDPSGRFVLYAHVDPAKQTGEKPDADIWVYDTQAGTQVPMVIAPGYDGGPFWSPDGSRICYRSDRAGTDLLQIYVADVRLGTGDHSGPSGVVREHQLTDNGHVNWGPFWHPSGALLLYASSQIGHRNYEVFALQVGADGNGTPSGTIETASASGGSLQRCPTFVTPRPSRRITHAPGADVLPAFAPDGQWLMWTAQRGEVIAGETRPSSQLWMARWNVSDPFPPAATNPSE